MGKLSLILSTIAWVLAYHLAGAIGGFHGKVVLAGIGIVAVTGASIYLAHCKRFIRSEIEPVEAGQIIAELEPPDWQGLQLSSKQKLLDFLFGVSFAFAPPILVSLIRGEAIHWDSQPTLWHLGALLGGMLGYIWLRRRLLAKWAPTPKKAKSTDIEER